MAALRKFALKRELTEKDMEKIGDTQGKALVEVLQSAKGPITRAQLVSGVGRKIKNSSRQAPETVVAFQLWRLGKLKPAIIDRIEAD